MHTTAKAFKLARTLNLLRHARKGTLVSHLARKFLTWKVLKAFGL